MWRRYISFWMLVAWVVSAVSAAARQSPAAPPSFAPLRTLYVSPRGSDSNSGLDPDHPLQTISGAALKVQPGDLVLVRAGLYLEHVRMRIAGTAARPIVFRAAPGETVIVTAGRRPSGWQRVANTRFAYEAPFPVSPLYVMEERELLRYVKAPEMDFLDEAPGSYLYDDARQMLIVHPLRGLHPDDAGATVVGLSNNLSDKGLWPFAAHNRVEGFHVTFQPIGIQLRADYAEAWGNTVYGCATMGIQSYLGLNTVIGNNTSFMNDESGLHVSTAAEGARVVGNLSWGNTPRGPTTPSDSGGHAYQLALYGSVPNPCVEGNLAINGAHPLGRGDRLMRYKSSTGATITRNNVLVGGKPKSGWGPGSINSYNTVLGGDLRTYSGNFLITPESAAANGSTAIGNLYLETVAQVSAAGFADPARFDYRLHTGSPHSGSGAWPTVAVVRYVSLSGSDSNNGLTPSTPWKTLAKACSAAQAGMTIYVMPGTYRESVALGTQGTAENPLEILTYGRGEVVLDGENLRQNALVLQNAKHVRLDGFVFKGYTGAAVSVSGSGGEGARLENNVFDGQSVAISLVGGGPAVVENNTFLGCGDAVYARIMSGRLELRNNLYANGGGSLANLDSPTRGLLSSERNAFAGAGAPAALAAWTAAVDEAHSSVVADVQISPPGYLLPVNERWSFAGIGHKPLGARGEPSDTSPIVLEDFRVIYAAPDVAFVEWYTPFDYPDATLQWQASGYSRKTVTVNQHSFDNTLRYARVRRQLLNLVPSKLFTVTLTLDTPDGRSRTASLQFTTPATPKPALTLYVSEQGDDGESGLSPELALRTINAAVLRAGPGSTINVGPGVYSEMVELVCGGVDAQNRLTLRSQPPGEAVIDAGELRPRAIEVANVAHVTLDGFCIRGLDYGSINRGVNLNRASDIEITRFLFEGRRDGSDGVTCLLIGGSYATDVRIYNNLFRHGFYNIQLTNSDNIHIDHNTFYGGGVCAIQLHGAMDASYTISNNIFQDVIAPAKRNPAIAINRPTDNLVVERNLYFRDKSPNMGLLGFLSDRSGATVDWGECARSVAEMYARFGVGEDDLVADPRFRAPAAGDFRLRDGSPGIAMAADGSDAGMLTPYSSGDEYHGDYFWEGGDSYWGNENNWDQRMGTPSSKEDTAIFNTRAQAPYTVRLTENNTVGAIRVRNDDVTLDLQGHTNTMVVPYHYVTDGAGQTGTLRIANGELDSQRNADEKALAPYLFVGYGAGSLGRLFLSGSDATLRVNTRFHIGQGKNSRGEVVIEDGARAIFGPDSVFYPGSEGEGRLVVRNASINSLGTLSLGINAGSYGEALFTGERTEWPMAGNVRVGMSGDGALRIENGVKVVPTRLYLYIGQETTSTGSVTLVGASIGVKEDGAGSTMSMTMGQSARVDVGSGGLPGGKGELNLLDGSAIKGLSSGADIKIYFYIGAGCALRIRDSWVDWCDGSYRNQPFRFANGSRYIVELTGNTRAFSAATPLVRSRAVVAGARTNIIDPGARLEIELAESYTHQPGAVFDIFRYDGDLQGEFDNLSDGDILDPGGHKFRINYGARTNSRISITATQTDTLILVR